MGLGNGLQIFILALFLSFSAFFSASETALMTLSKIRIRNMIKQNIKGSELIGRLVDNPSKLLGAILVGNNVVNIGASALATSLAIKYFGTTGVGIATGIMTVLVLVFGEITPKSLAAQNSEKVSLKVAPLLHIVTVILSPLTAVLMRITNVIIKLLGGKVDERQPFITEEELKTMINVGHEEGVLEREEKQIIHNIIEFGHLQVRDAMTPRTDILAVEAEAGYDDIMNKFRSMRFSRLPVYKDKIDNIIGVLHLKDLFFSNIAEEGFDMNQYMRTPYFTYKFRYITELFADMRSNGVQMAIVLDEYGGTAGIVTLEDLVEEIVGEIYDEYDEGDVGIALVKENEYMVYGTLKIEAIAEYIGLPIETENFESIGGYVMGLFGRLPKEGETVEEKGIRFEVEKVEKNRIVRIRVFT